MFKKTIIITISCIAFGLGIVGLEGTSFSGSKADYAGVPCYVSDSSDEYAVDQVKSKYTLRELIVIAAIAHREAEYENADGETIENPYADWCNDGKDPSGRIIRKIIIPPDTTVKLEKALPPLFVAKDNILIIEGGTASVIDGGELKGGEIGLYVGFDAELYAKAIDGTEDFEEIENSGYGADGIQIKKLTFKGFKGTVIHVKEGTDVVVEGVTIEGGGLVDGGAIEVDGGDSIWLAKNVIKSSNGHGIVMRGGADHYIYYNEIKSSGRSAILVEDDTGTSGKITVEIVNNKLIDNNGAGVTIENSKNVYITHNKMGGNKSPAGGIENIDGANGGLIPPTLSKTEEEGMLLSVGNLQKEESYLIEIYYADEAGAGLAAEGKEYLNYYLFTKMDEKEVMVKWPENIDKTRMITYTIISSNGGTSNFAPTVDPSDFSNLPDVDIVSVHQMITSSFAKIPIENMAQTVATNKIKIPVMGDESKTEEETPPPSTEGSGEEIQEHFGVTTEVGEKENLAHDQSASLGGCSLNRASNHGLYGLIPFMVFAIILIPLRKKISREGLQKAYF